MFADTGGQTNEDITSFLRKKFGVIGRAEEVTLFFSTKVNGAAVLKVSDACFFNGHLSLAPHGKICLAVKVCSFDRLRGLFLF